MKYICLVLLLSLAAHGSLANPAVQGSAEVEVLKWSWSKERIGWEGDPFRGPVENFDEVRARTRNEKRIDDAKRGNSAETDKIKQEAKADAANIETQHKNVPSRYVFIYKTRIRNGSTKTIKSIDWDYIFRDVSNDTELNRQQFTSDETIGPGKSKELMVVLRKPPTQTISVTSLNTSEKDSLKGEVVLVRIEFSDGSVWQAQ
jgi:hypothetical protein